LSLFSFSIELFQYFIGEVADVDDLIQNLLGSAFGYTIFSFINHCVRSNKQKQRMKLME